MGSCINTLVSSTNSLVGPVCFFFAPVLRSTLLAGIEMGLRETGLTVLAALSGAGASTSGACSCRVVGLRVLRDLLGVAASKPSVFNKAARLAGAGGNGIDET